jgi:hypothetical protein
MPLRESGQSVEKDLREPILPARRVPELPADAVDRRVQGPGELVISEVVDDLQRTLVAQGVGSEQ